MNDINSWMFGVFFYNKTRILLCCSKDESNTWQIFLNSTLARDRHNSRSIITACMNIICSFYKYSSHRICSLTSAGYGLVTFSGALFISVKATKDPAAMQRKCSILTRCTVDLIQFSFSDN